MDTKLTSSFSRRVQGLKGRAAATVFALSFFATASAGPLSATIDPPNQTEPGVSPRIIGGIDAPVGRYPFIATIQSAFGEHDCGGTLISPDLVLTAAHCVTEDMHGEPVIVARTSLMESTQGYARRVKRAHIHPEWPPVDPESNGGSWFDIALIELDHPITEVAPIRLVNSGNSAYQEPGQNAQAIGWGLTRPPSTDNRWPDHLQEATLSILSVEDCQRDHPGLDRALDICAGTSKANVCYSDSGGPLFAWEPGTGRPIQIGVVSRGSKSAPCSGPTLFTKLSNAEVSRFIAYILRKSSQGTGLQ